MTLTNENYYSREANIEYMSATQFKAFQRCEAAALAEVQGIYTPPVTTAMLVGSYVDAHFSGEIDAFKEAHPEIFKRDGSLKADYAAADEIIKVMRESDLYARLMEGRKQVIVTGEIAGVPFRGKIDSLLDKTQCREIVMDYPNTRAALGMMDGAIVDQKVMRGLGDVWSSADHSYIPFVEAYGYDVQGAIYRELEGHMLPFILAVATKEDPAALAALYIPDDDLTAALDRVEELAPRYDAIKHGRAVPTRCGHCAYCRATAKLDRIIDYHELHFGGEDCE